MDWQSIVYWIRHHMKIIIPPVALAIALVVFALLVHYLIGSFTY